MLLCLILRLQVGRSFAITDGFRSVCGRLSFDLRLFVVGALPLLPTDCPYRARYHLNPVVGGDPGCRSLRSLYPGLRYHCLRRSQASPQHSSCKQACLALHSVCTDIALTGRHGFKTSDVRHVRKDATVWNLGLCVWILKKRIGMTNDTEG